MSELIKVAQTDQLPVGARKLCTIEDRRIAIFNLAGTLYAIDNHCTHRDGPVGAGELNDAVITCPWHGWRFNVTSGRCLEDGANLRCYPVQVEGSDVLVAVTPTDESNSDDGIYCYLVRYGALRHVSRVGSINRIPCRRGDRVVERLCGAPHKRSMTDRPRRFLHAPAGPLLFSPASCRRLVHSFARVSIILTASPFDSQTNTHPTDRQPAACRK